jgi:SpoVK/Ycf46/Vps4 family AAA+-type ATPase
MTRAVERAVMNAVVMYQQRKKWKQWGLHLIRKQGACILLEGPAGCGKTVIAEYLALRIRKKGMKLISFADFGSHVPGENSRQIRKLFEDARENGEMTIAIDECEAILWDRGRAGASAMWMLEVIDELLVQIGKYPGLIILMTNMAQILDAALSRRLIAHIHVDRPELPERVRLWQDKFPDSYPLKLSIKQVNEIATLQLSGAEIENVIIEYSSDCIRLNKKPTFEGLYEFADRTADRIQQDAIIREKAKNPSDSESIQQS